jgi:hypothetical protein
MSRNLRPWIAALVETAVDIGRVFKEPVTEVLPAEATMAAPGTRLTFTFDPENKVIHVTGDLGRINEAFQVGDCQGNAALYGRIKPITPIHLVGGSPPSYYAACDPSVPIDPSTLTLRHPLVNVDFRCPRCFSTP